MPEFDLTNNFEAAGLICALILCAGLYQIGSLIFKIQGINKAISNGGILLIIPLKSSNVPLDNSYCIESKSKIFLSFILFLMKKVFLTLLYTLKWFF